jgi:hypothetical protein
MSDYEGYGTEESENRRIEMQEKRVGFVKAEARKEIAALTEKVAKDYERRLNAMDALYKAEKEKLVRGILDNDELILNHIDIKVEQAIAAIEGEVKGMREEMDKRGRLVWDYATLNQVLAIIDKFKEGK